MACDLRIIFLLPSQPQKPAHILRQLFSIFLNHYLVLSLVHVNIFRYNL